MKREMKREEQMMDEAEAYAAGLYADEPVSFSTEEDMCVTMNDFCAGWRAADSHPNWIPVEERLPEVGKNVLVWSSGFDEPMVGFYGHWNWQHKHHIFYVHNGRNSWDNITHWMPLPQPPKKGGEQ